MISIASIRSDEHTNKRNQFRDDHSVIKNYEGKRRREWLYTLFHFYL